MPSLMTRAPPAHAGACRQPAVQAACRRAQSIDAYAVPEPAGLKEARVRPDAAFYHREMGEFILPYEAVRTSADPAAAIRQFIDTTYEQAATLAKWDRNALERT